MKYILFIVGMILWVGISARKYARKQISDLEDDSYQQKKPSRPAFESLFVDEPKAETSFAEEEAAAGYFTYESEPVAPQPLLLLLQQEELWKWAKSLPESILI